MGKQIVKHLDRLTIRVDNPNPLFTLLTEQLLLPVAWPVTTNPFYTSGGVHLGNTNLEILNTGAEKQPARLYGLSFEMQPFAASLPALEKAGLPHTPPLPFYQFDEQGWQSMAWSSTYLGGLLNRSNWRRLFFSASRSLPADAWEQRLHPTPFNRRFFFPLLYHRVFPEAMLSGLVYNPAWYVRNIQSPSTRVGLEVRGLNEVVVGVTDFPKHYLLWRKLLAGHREVVEAVWMLPDGAHIRLAPAVTPGLQSMTWQVESLNRAAQFLYKRGLLGEERDKTLSIPADRVFGLDIRLIQA